MDILIGGSFIMAILFFIIFLIIQWRIRVIRVGIEGWGVWRAVEAGEIIDRLIVGSEVSFLGGFLCSLIFSILFWGV